MDTFESTGSVRRSKKIKVSIPAEHNGGIHEESRHHFRLHEETVPRPQRPALPCHGAEQEIRTCKFIILYSLVKQISLETTN